MRRWLVERFFAWMQWQRQRRILVRTAANHDAATKLRDKARESISERTLGARNQRRRGNRKERMSPRAELVKQISQPVVNQAGPHLWRRRSTRCRVSSSPIRPGQQSF